jgi:long-chain fatty acid transport protein
MANRFSTRGAVLAVALVFTAAAAHAAGFGIFEQGTRAMGMGMAYTAQADDPSALFYNAGGLAFMEERDFSLGFTYITATTAEYKGLAGTPLAGAKAEQEKLSEFPVHGYWIEPISRDWKFGLALTSPFGLTTEWKDPANFPGRYLSTKAALRAIDLNPTIGWQVTPNFGLGFGAIARFSDVELHRYIPAQIPGTPIVLDGGRVDLDSSFEPGFGFNVGFLHKYNNSFQWGMSYRSKVKIDYSGDARFTQIPTGIPPLDAALAAVIPFGQKVPVETQIEFPDMASLGVNVALSANTRLEVDVNWTGWSSFDEVPLDFKGHPLISGAIPEEWEDVMNYRLGFLWKVPSGSEWRFGYIYDETPQPDKHVSPLLPDANRNGYTVGWGRQFSSTNLDLALMYLPFDERTTRTNTDGFNGTYNQTAWLFGATIGF